MSVGLLVCTLGDPFSINCEAILKTTRVIAKTHAVVLVGSFWQWTHQAKVLNQILPEMSQISEIKSQVKAGYFFLDPLPQVGCRPPQELSAEERGQLMCAALLAVPKASADKFAVLTCPIDKSAASKAGFRYPGQTEFFENLWADRAVMLLAGPKLRVALVTNHLALSDVPKALTQDLIIQKLEILGEGLRDLFGIALPRIAVCGLNPHAGDQGLFGDEEKNIIAPAIAKLRLKRKDFDIAGPLPADTAFYRAYNGAYDAVLAMYHDQGLGPLKTVHFDDAVNVSLGLKNLRVSPDHGPAVDLYTTGRASFKSFDAAVTLCSHWLKTVTK